MIKIKDISIERRKDYPYDIAHLVKVGRFVDKGKQDFRGKGFQNEGQNKVYASIVRRAETLDSNLVIIEEEYSNKRGLYKVSVTFYKDLVDQREMPEGYMYHL